MVWVFLRFICQSPKNEDLPESISLCFSYLLFNFRTD